MACQAAATQGDNKLRKGTWLEEEDEQLVTFVTLFGDRKWDFIATASGLHRTGKSCRLRWLNYLRPNLKRGQISAEEEKIIIQLHELWGNKWAKIARRLPGRTDNDIKNYWRTHLKKKLQAQEENFRCKVNIAKQDFLYQKGDTNSLDCNMGDYKSVEDKVGTKESPLGQHYELSSSTYLNSPYETRLYDWMPELSGDQTEMKIHGDSGGLDSCFCYLKWNSEDGDTSILDSLGSLWDMN
ncbi:hypothetical protein P3X46_004084 [Hevea brasiliensis]|uniref:Uncharacterized protein n=1 Tax=Hevea brasiliensis TaxID=3981 RepID=A0ABQ9MVM9_HEVBR|nr:hypothetical protein P3X46_004084 [Hevea brasiliensis]